MSDVYAVPGVYITETSGLSLSIQSGETAVPLFVGVFNPLTPPEKDAPLCVRIESWLDFISKFGSSDYIHVSLKTNAPTVKATPYHGYYCLRLYFENGGGPCYILNYSRQDFDDASKIAGIGEAIAHCPDITLLCYCEFINPKLDNEIYAALDNQLGSSQTSGGNRGTFLLTDAMVKAKEADAPSAWTFTVPQVKNASQVAAYFPGLVTPYTRDYRSGAIWVDDTTPAIAAALKKGSLNSPFNFQHLKAEKAEIAKAAGVKAGQEFHAQADMKDTGQVNNARKAEVEKVEKETLEALDLLISTTEEALRNHLAEQQDKADPIYLRASVAMAGVYARVDRERGVWKAPANVVISGVTGLIAAGFDESKKWKAPLPLQVDDALNEKLVGSKINAIREFRGRGVMVWGARTMNDPALTDWRYIQVRRLFNAIERDARSALRQAVFEPNSPATWEQVRGALDNYLHALWRKGALQGETPEQAYNVQMGLGLTMTQDDINNGRMIARIGVAAVRPAEFIVLELSQDVAVG